MCAIPRYLIPIGELHAVHDEHHRPAGQDLLAVQFHIHRQSRLQRRASIAARGISLVPAHADQPHAKIAHRALEQLLTIHPQVACGEVADEDRIITLHLGQGAGKILDPHQAGFQARRLQRRSQRPVLIGLGRDHQHSRFAAHGGECGGAIVLRQRVARRIHAHVITVKAFFGQRLREGEQVFPSR